VKDLNKSLPEFREWLETRDNIQKVGVPRRIQFCPVATWLREREDRDDIFVEYWHIRRGSRASRTPLWVRMYISKIDRAVAKEDAVVPKRTALEVLSEVEKLTARKR
jgi:hypothetical protein